MKKNINKLVQRIIKESLEGKANELENKINMDEWDQQVTLSPNPDDISEDMVDSDIESRLCNEKSPDYSESRCKYNKSIRGKMTKEMEEELIGGQKKLDKDKNGVLNKKDFEMLRKGKKSMEESKEMCSECGGMMYEGVCNECGYSQMDEGNEFTGELEKARKEHKKEFKVGGKTFPVREGKKEKFIQKATKKMEKKGTEGSFKEYCGGEVTKSCIDKAMKSGDAKLIKKANFAKNIGAYQGAKHKKKSVKESLKLTESEMIDLIEKIVVEEKKAKGLAQTEKILNQNKKENEKAIKDVTKKMKEYLKDGSKGDYSTNPENFPKGNGELAKMKKMAYEPSKDTQEYIDNFTAAGLENIVYDEIHPNEEWTDDNVEGSSRTGNNPKWGNAVDTGVNKKRNKIRKDNLLGAVKAMAYNKAPQPVVDAAKKGAEQKFDRNFGKGAGTKATKILNQLESTENKQDILISEEFEKIKHLMDYNKKTQ